jgi:hypothetical protein
MRTITGRPPRGSSREPTRVDDLLEPSGITIPDALRCPPPPNSAAITETSELTFRRERYLDLAPGSSRKDRDRDAVDRKERG